VKLNKADAAALTSFIVEVEPVANSEDVSNSNNSGKKGFKLALVSSGVEKRFAI
jgi:hypothetical protein